MTYVHQLRYNAANQQGGWIPRFLRECECLTKRGSPSVSTGQRVDKSNGLIRGVKILSSESRNGRTYTTDCLSRARALYEGVSVRINHQPGDSEADRDANDVLGRLVNVRATPKGLYGDLEYLKSHPMSRRLVEAAERMPAAYGLSHNVTDWKGHYEGGKYIVDEILEVESVDLVADPATTNGLFESHRKRRRKTMKLLEWMRSQKPAVRASFRRLIEADAASPSMLLDDGGTNPEVAIKQAFRAAIMAVVDDDSADMATSLGKIKSIIKAREDLMASGAVTPPTADDAAAVTEAEPAVVDDKLDEPMDDTDDDSDDDLDSLEEGSDLEPDEDEDDMAFKESKQPEPDARALREENQRLKRELEVRRLCESEKIKPTPAMLRALTALDSEADRRELLRESRRATARKPADDEDFVLAITSDEDGELD